jgi:hypothetical protein
MFIRLESTSFTIIIVFEKIEFYRLKDKKNQYSFIIIINIINMWFISRCISVDSLNSCFQQQKNKMSYDFGLCQERTGILSVR